MYPRANEKICKLLEKGIYKNTKLFAQERSCRRGFVSTSWKVPSVRKENSKTINSNLREVFRTVWVELYFFDVSR